MKSHLLCGINFLIIIFLIFFIPFACLAQARGFRSAISSDIPLSPEEVKGTRWALLIGISDYPSSPGFEIQKLKAPVKDVNALADFLKDKEKGGFEGGNVITLTDEQASRRNILINFNDIKNKAAPEDMVIFYFSGHGTRHPETEVTYLIPYDHDLRDIETTCIDFDDLASKIRRMEAKKIVVILDACHSGGIKQEGARAALDSGLVKRYMEAFEASEGRALLLSSDESQVSWETEDNGIFTKFLLQAMEGEADSDGDGIVTFSETASYVEEKVPEYTRENFPSIQRPTRRYEFGQVRGDIPLAINWKKVNVQHQQRLLDARNTTIFRSGLEGDIEEFSLQIAKSVFDKTVAGQEISDEESKLISQLDKLMDNTIDSADYSIRSRAIMNLSMGELTVSVNPPDSKVMLESLDNPQRILSSNSSNTFNVKPGTYKLLARREGYEAYSRNISISQEKITENIQLKKLKGKLQLKVDPPDANVQITPIEVPAPEPQSRSMKKTSPNEAEELPVGTYKVIAQKDGYEPVIKGPIEIKPDGTIQITLVLKPVVSEPEPTPVSSLTVKTNPPDARITLAPTQNPGQLISPESAGTYNVEQGRYRLRAERDGYEPYFQEIDVNRPEETASIEMKKLTGTLKLKVSPADAKATIKPFRVAAPDTGMSENKAITVRSGMDKKLPVGTYRLNIEKSGYEAIKDRSFSISSNTPTQLSLSLKRLGGAGDVVDTRPIKTGPRTGGLQKPGKIAASLVIPGLGQHLQKQHVRGFVYEALVVGAGIAAMITHSSYQGALDDYTEAKDLLSSSAPDYTEFNTTLRELEIDQEDKYNKAKSARNLAIISQMAIGVVWGLSAIDAAVTPSYDYNSSLSLHIGPVSDGSGILVSSSF